MSGSSFCSSIFFLYGVGAMMVMPCSPFFYMTLKLVFPLIVSGYQSGVRLLHIDEHGVVYRIAVEAGHNGQIAHILFTLKQFLDALLDAICDFPLAALGWWVCSQP